MQSLLDLGLGKVTVLSSGMWCYVVWYVQIYHRFRGKYLTD